jgi:adenylate cyclase
MGAGMNGGERAPADTIKIGEFELDLGRGLLLRGGRSVSTRARSFALLAYLARNANRVVSRDEIFASVWKGVAVTDDALTQTVRDLRNALEDGAQDLIKTVTKRGYMLTVPGSPSSAEAASAPPEIFGDARPNVTMASGGAGARGVFAIPSGEAPLASIAVLPFANLSSDGEQDYFALGLAEDLIADLSKLRGLTVIARHSSFAFADRALDPRLVSGRLGVRYLVEGSVRRASNRVRINVQLLDATRMTHIWADRFDGDLTDVFRLQDAVIAKIVKALAGVLSQAEPAYVRRPTNVMAYELFLQGKFSVTQNLVGNRASRVALSKAVELQPDYCDAFAWLAYANHFAWLYGGEPESIHRPAARAVGLRALQLDEENADAQTSFAKIRAHEGDLDEATARLERALRINPNHADAWMFFSEFRVFEGRAADAIDCNRSSFRLNPIPPAIYFWGLGFAQYAAGRYEDAVATMSDPSLPPTGFLRILAASLAKLGRREEAADAARLFLQDNPGFSTSAWARTQPFRHPADLQHFVDGYALAGLPK